MPVAGLRRIALEFSLSNGDVAVNVLHVKQDTPTTFDAAEAQTLAELVEQEWWDHYKTGIANVVSLASITVADASGQTGLSFEDTIGSAGGAAATPLPYQVAAVVSLRTALNSRSGRGRIFVAGWNEAGNTSAAKIDPAAVDALHDAMVNLMTALAAADYQLVVYSRKLDQANPVTTVLVDDRWDIQRRRANAS